MFPAPGIFPSNRQLPFHFHRAPVPEEEPLPGEEPGPDQDEPPPHPDPEQGKQ